MALKEQMELFDNGGLMQEGGTVDPMSGNEVPFGSTQEEVRDDIPAHARPHNAALVIRRRLPRAPLEQANGKLPQRFGSLLRQQIPRHDARSKI